MNIQPTFLIGSTARDLMEMNWQMITADQPIYAAEIASPETDTSFHHSIQYQVDTPGDILHLAQSVVGSLW